ncbi:hypothetical protein [Aquimarina sp. AU474]|uniref:hypothetical protein n=1 Tax=Aquimarina sp. AU474 TaxID=2108529 RepID=UPI000D6970B1|nr:hypothetical protein [Aquimarina sp. AU474]
MKKLLLLLLITQSIFSQIDEFSVMGLPTAATNIEMNAVTAASTGSILYNLEEGKIFVYDGTNWVSTSNDNWLVDGNTGLPTTSFLGHIDDVAMEIRSNNLPLLRFGRRQTLGLTQGFPDYTDDDQPLVFVNGDGNVSALQFAASGAGFYKPLFFTTTNGSFRLKGSTGGSDLFEIGSAGPANDGRLEFIIGDDGAEPIIFKRYDFRRGQFNREFFRVQGSNNTADATTRFGINLNPQEVPVDADYDDSSAGFAIANSTLQLEGSFSTSILNTTGNLTLTEDHHTIVITGTHNITLPAANTCEGRMYVIKNRTNVNRTISTYVDLTNSNQSTITNESMLWIKSDGTNWQQINNNSDSGSSVIVSADANNDITTGTDGGAFYNAPNVRVFEAYDNAGGTAANEGFGTYNILNLDTQRTNQSGFVLNNDRVTIPEDGIYEIGYSVTFASNAGNNNNSTVETIIFLNLVEIDGSSTYVTLDNNGDDYSASKNLIISLSNGDELLLGANRTGTTSGTANTVADGTNITVKKLD